MTDATIIVDLSKADAEVMVEPGFVPALAGAIEATMRAVASADPRFAGATFALRLTGMAGGSLTFRLEEGGTATDTPMVQVLAAVGGKLGYLRPQDGATIATDATAELVAAHGEVQRVMEQLVFVADGAQVDRVMITLGNVPPCEITDLPIDPAALVGSRAVAVEPEVEGAFSGPLDLTGELLSGAIQFPRGEASEVCDMAVGTLYTEVGVPLTAVVVWGSERPAPTVGEIATRHVVGMLRPLRLAKPVPSGAVGARAREAQVVLFVSGETVTETR